MAGVQVVTWTFLPLLLRSSDARLVFIAGLAHITIAAESYFPTPPLPAGWPKTIDFETIGYRASKVALNMVMLDWNHKLKADGVKVWGVEPGFLATNLGNNPDKLKAMGAGPPAREEKWSNRWLKGSGMRTWGSSSRRTAKFRLGERQTYRTDSRG